MSRSVRILLAGILVFSMLSFAGFAGAAPATGEIVWDTQADFQANASTTDATTTITGASTARTPGSVMLPGPVAAVATGFSHTVGLALDGTVVAVGQNSFGQLNVSGWSDITTITAGYFNTYGITSTGTVVAVGYDSYGQLGVSGWTDIVQVAAGFHHAVGLKSDGTVVGVGSNDNGTGQINVSSWSDIVGVSAGNTHTVGLKSDGTVVQTGSSYGDLSGWTDIVAVAAGGAHTVGLRSDGTVVAVGDNLYGECDVSGWADIIAISSSYQHTVGLKDDGTLVAVGDDPGDGRTAVVSMDHVTAIAAGGAFTVGLDHSGRVVSVGENTDGQRNTWSWCDYVGIAGGADYTVGLQSDGSATAVGTNTSGQCNVAAWWDVVAIGACFQHTVGVNSDGSVVAVGSNTFGEIEVTGWTDIVGAAAGYYHTVGVRSDGTVVAVGAGGNNQCDVSGWTDIVAVAANSQHTLGLKSDGTVVGTGYNGSGQLGVTGWTDIVEIATGVTFSLGLKSDGTVVAVGDNGFGQLGAAAWTDVVAVAAGEGHAVGLRSDGTVVAAGLDGNSQLAVSGWTDIVAVSAGSFHTVGLKSDGTVVVTDVNDTSGWTSLTPGAPRYGMIGGSDAEVGLRAQAPSAGARWSGLSASTSRLTPTQAVKFAVRTSNDGIAWSEPLGSDGDPIDWTTGTGNYLGRAVTDSSARTDLSWFADAEYIDIVVRVETDGVLSPELMSVTVEYAENTAPVAVDDDASCDEDDSVTVFPLENDTDVDGDSLTLEIVDEPSNGTAQNLGGGEVLYTPDPDWSGTDTFTYLAGDDTALSNLGTVTITVNEVFDLPVGVVRVSGANRYETGVKASEQAFPDGAGTVVIATGANWPDALGGSALAGAVDGPLLLTTKDALPQDVVDEIARLKVSEAYILGGTSAVGTAVESALKTSLGSGNVTRLSGADRYITARKVADEVISLAGAAYDKTAYVATGANFPDALAVSPVAAALARPILLANPNSGAVSVPPAVDEAYILGGTSAVSGVSEAALKTALGAGNVVRVSGANRYATAVAIAQHGVGAGLDWNGVGLATGTNFPDGLSGGAMLGRMGTVMLLTPSDVLAPEVKTVLQNNASSIDTLFIMGGTAAVSDSVAAQARAAAGL